MQQDGGEKSLDCQTSLYYFHGLGDNAQMFLHSGGFDLVQELWDRRQMGGFIIVSPAGYASFFMNSHDGRFRYDDFFLREFIPSIENRYRIAARRESRGIGGISMGGYGALRMAFLHPQLFGSVSAHSAAFDGAPSGSDREQLSGIGTVAAFGKCLWLSARSSVLGTQ